MKTFYILPIIAALAFFVSCQKQQSEDEKKALSGEQAKYARYINGQVHELLTGYGTIDLLWFDGEWERSPTS